MMSTSNGSQTILIAEDNPDDAHLARLEFDHAGIRNEVVIVDDGDTIIDYLENRPPFENNDTPGLVILDLHLPRVDGAAVVRHLAGTRFAHVPIIIMSSPTELPWVDEKLHNQISGMLAKPITVEGLIEVVSSIDALAQDFLQLS